ncbi:MAG: cyclic nucleotide-binding domain-containing protein, partial [Acidimicrobiales bacterium]
MSIVLSPGVTQLDPPPDAVETLAATDLLAPASREDIEAVAGYVGWLRLDAGTELFAAGAVADGMYLVVRGRLESHIDNELLGEIGRGGTVGETALLGETRRTASVRAVRDSVVARIPPDRVPELAVRSPGVSLGLARLVARRAAGAPPLVRAATPPRSIGVVALDGSDIAADLARSVTERLGQPGDHLILTAVPPRRELSACDPPGGDE